MVGEVWEFWNVCIIYILFGRGQARVLLMKTMRRKTVTLRGIRYISINLGVARPLRPTGVYIQLFILSSVLIPHFFTMWSLSSSWVPQLLNRLNNNNIECCIWYTKT